ncbi:MAG: hypothetical protein ACE5H9_08895 [Anaerolineae bacterium]
MSSYRRPWWVIALRAPLLATTMQEAETEYGSKITVEGKPAYYSATWITCGPALALLWAILLGVGAGLYGVREQPRALILAFVAVMVISPIAVWVGSSRFLSRAAERHLARQAEANAVRLTLQLDNRQGQLSILKGNEANPRIIPYETVERVSLVTRGSTSRMVVETTTDQIEILEHPLGTERFKSNLAAILRRALHADGGGH